jgi:tetratricopeptide (TPR) repeat protein
MNARQLALFALLFLPATGVAVATAAQTSVLDDPVFQEETRLGLQYLYDMDFAGADATFSKIGVRYPGHPVGPFLHSLIPWWAIQLEPDDASQDPAFLKAMDEVIDVCDRRLKADPEDLDALFFKAGAHAFRGRVHSDRTRWIKAARDGHQALRALRAVRERAPDNDDLYFGIGLFDYLVDVIPRRYRVLRPFARLFPKGDKERGLQELDRAMTRGKFVPTEVAYSLLQIQYIFEENFSESLRYATWLRQRHPDNSIFHLYQGRAFERLGRLQDANRTFHEILERHAKGQSGYTDAMAERALYLLTRVEMQWRRYDVALADIDRLERLTASRDVESEYKVLGRLRRGMVFDALGRRKEAVVCYKQVLKMDSDGNAHERARTYLKKPYGSG